MIDMDHVTTGGALGAVVSPLWLPVLTPVSQVAAILLPILGCVWLAVQITFKIKDRKKP